MVARSQNQLVAAQPEKTGERTEHNPGPCAYCVPANPSKDVEPGDECLIKMLGSEERKQVALALYRVGREKGLFNKQCPMSEDKAYGKCPFYENTEDLVDES